MAICVAEYLGVRTDLNYQITPIRVGKNSSTDSKPTLPCPFKNSHCEKAKRGDKPVCSIRDTTTKELWIPEFIQLFKDTSEIFSLMTIEESWNIFKDNPSRESVFDESCEFIK